MPPLATALTAVMNWIGLTVLVWPKEIVAKSISVIFSVFLTIPNFLIYSFNFSAPNFSPKFINPTLHEFCIISSKVWVPCPPLFQHLMNLSPFCRPPLQVYVSSLPATPSWTAAEAVIILKIEPGSKESETDLFLHIFWILSEEVFPEKFSAPS